MSPQKSAAPQEDPQMKLAEKSKYQNTRNMEKLTSPQSANSLANDLKDTEVSKALNEDFKIWQ